MPRLHTEIAVDRFTLVAGILAADPNTTHWEANEILSGACHTWEVDGGAMSPNGFYALREQVQVALAGLDSNDEQAINAKLPWAVQATMEAMKAERQANKPYGPKMQRKAYTRKATMAAESTPTVTDEIPKKRGRPAKKPDAVPALDKVEDVKDTSLPVEPSTSTVIEEPSAGTPNPLDSKPIESEQLAA